MGKAATQRFGTFSKREQTQISLILEIEQTHKLTIPLLPIPYTVPQLRKILATGKLPKEV